MLWNKIAYVQRGRLNHLAIQLVLRCWNPGYLLNCRHTKNKLSICRLDDAEIESILNTVKAGYFLTSSWCLDELSWCSLMFICKTLTIPVTKTEGCHTFWYLISLDSLMMVCLYDKRSQSALQISNQSKKVRVFRLSENVKSFHSSFPERSFQKSLPLKALFSS